MAQKEKEDILNCVHIKGTSGVFFQFLGLILTLNRNFSFLKIIHYFKTKKKNMNVYSDTYIFFISNLA